MLARYRQAEFETFTLDEGVTLMHSKVSYAAEPLSTDDARLLAYCRTFRTLEKHALQWSREVKFQGLQDLSRIRAPRFLGGAFKWLRNYAERHRSEIAVDGKQLASVRQRLEALAASGFLVSDEDLVCQCKQALRTPTEDPPPVTALAMATRGRGELLRRGIASYSGNSARFGRSVDFIVIDDAREPEGQRRTLEVLKELNSSQGVMLRHASRQDREAFADRLAAYSGLPRDPICFALLGRPASDRTVGSCYNSLLLDTVGGCCVIADDDTVCQIAAPP